MIHPYLKSVGFSECKDRSQLNKLLSEIIANPTFTKRVARSDGTKLGLYAKDFAPGAGVAVCGEYDDRDNFIFEYYYPYVKGSSVSTKEEMSLERATMQDSLEGIVDESRVGVSLIFFVVNMLDCVEQEKNGKQALKKATLTLMSFADSGSVLLPIAKSPKDKVFTRNKNHQRLNMIMDAKKGNESAIENLTLEEMDTYTTVSKKIKNSDIFTLVDTYFMPNGVECDHYSVLGEIVNVRYLTNEETKENMVIITLLCNELPFDVCLNEADLKGEPIPGRRFKGNIWMQGRVNFQDN